MLMPEIRHLPLARQLEAKVFDVLAIYRGTGYDLGGLIKFGRWFERVALDKIVIGRRGLIDAEGELYALDAAGECVLEHFVVGVLS